MRAWFIVLVFLLGAPVAYGHEVRPAYLEIQQTGTDTYDVFWKVPARGDDMRLGIYAELPPNCLNAGARHASLINNTFTERWSAKCAGGLPGGAIHIDRLAETQTDVLARFKRLDGSTQVARLTPSAPSVVVEAAPDNMQVASIYTRLGIEHILTGVDHLLFILALLFLVRGWKRVVATITAFTAAHSLTLAAATLGWVQVPQAPVEACIALSIAFVAREIVCSLQGKAGLTERQPWLVAFAFGLLHGFGFAGALREVGLPQTAIPVALFLFNVGVEIGQLLFIGAVVAVMAAGRKTTLRLRRAIQQPVFSRLGPAYAIGGVAMFWVAQRVLAF